ncbi:MAG: DUF4199 domain-containing protein [Bacteroidota bacterium]
MKKNILIYGLIAGLIITTMMVCTAYLCYQKEDFQGNMFLGYATMIVAFSMIFVGIKNYRDKQLGGIISFGSAFKLGLYISLIASTMYVVVWLFDYYLFIPDFMEKYSSHVIKQYQDSGMGAAELKKEIDNMNWYKDMYKNPLFVVLLTYMEVLPVGAVVALISALILKKKSISLEAQV